MSDLNVKVGLIGKFDMLKFKNMRKNREKTIQAAPANEVNGVFAINEDQYRAGYLLPSKRELHQMSA